MRIDHASRTDVGRSRSRNEDNFLSLPDIGLYVVADGMGGHKGGDEASRIACLAAEDFVRTNLHACEGVADYRAAYLDLVAGSVAAANESVLAEGDRHPELAGMGSTLVVVLFTADRAFVASLGDSRVYLVRNGAACLATEDHSLFFELIRQGRLGRQSRFPYKNVVTRALGMRGLTDPDCFDVQVLPGDRFVLCSDGFSGFADDAQVAKLAAEGAPRAAVDRMVDFANEAGGTDNITVTLVEVEAIDADVAVVRAEQRASRSFPILKGLSTAEWIKLMAACDRREAADGEVLFGEGETCDGLYGVLSGSVEIRRNGKAVQVFGPGEHLGEMSLVEGTPRLATARAVGTTVLAVLPRERFESLLKVAPRVSSRLLKNLVRILTWRLRATNDELVVIKSCFDAGDVAAPSVLSSDMLVEERETAEGV
jgi:serine/threonine protein phosphatase PrpC/CRP-like cAMP-binding protein